MRTLAQVELEIADYTSRLSQLRAERSAIVAGHLRAIVAEFDAGVSTPEIAERTGMTQSAVRGILTRAGRTVRGRAAVRARIAEAVSQGAPA